MPEPFLPYCRHRLGDEEVEAVVAVLREGPLTRGPRARAFEEACAERLDARHAVACASGSAALEVALRALGIGPGDDVVVPSLTWVATAGAVRLVGARPVFADVSPFTRCVTAETVREAWTPATRAVICVDFAGVPCDVSALRNLCDARGAWLVEDAAHAFGARRQDGSPVGADGWAHAATFSFHPAKTITTAEGGLVTCADDLLAERLRRVRSGGITRDFQGSRGPWDLCASELGGNHHLSELHAALGLVQLGRVDALVEARRRAGLELRDALAARDALAGRVHLPAHPAGSAWNLFVVELAGDEPDSAERDGVLARLRERAIGAHVHYPLLHRQPVFRDDGVPRPRLPHSERYERRALTLPLFPDLAAADIERVADALADAVAGAPAASRPVPRHA